MPYEALITGSAGFTKIDFCDRTTKRDLNVDAVEDMGAFGIIWGALSGLFKFVFLCRGVSVIYLGSLSSKNTKSAKRGCERCMGDPRSDVVDVAAQQSDIDVKVMTYQ